MENLSKILGQILLYISTYPVTLFNILLFPSKVLGKQKISSVCPPSNALIISYLLIGVVWPYSNYDRIEIIVFSFIAMAFIVGIQWALTSRIFRLQNDGTSSFNHMQLLFYPYSWFLLISAISFPFTKAAYQQVPIISTFYLLSFFTNIFIYSWAMFNVFRIGFDVSFLKSILAAIICLVVFFVLAFLIMMLINSGVLFQRV